MDPQGPNQPPATPNPRPEQPDTPTPFTPQPEAQAEPAVTPVEPPVPPAQPAAPAPQPGTFQPVPTPIGGAPAGTSASSGPKKGLIIGIIAGVVALLIIIVVAVLIVSSMSVSKKDYAAAYRQFSDVSSANSTLLSKTSALQYSSSSTDTMFDNDIDAARAAIDDVKAENEELGKLKAVKVGDGEKKYKAFNEKLDAYTTYVDDLITSLNDARGASKKCSGSNFSSSDVSQLKSAIADCITALKKISNTPNTDVKEFMNKMKDEYENLSSVVTKLAAIKDPYGSQYSKYTALRNQTYDILDRINDAEADFKSNLNKHMDEVNPSDAADDLADYLSEKMTKN